MSSRIEVELTSQRDDGTWTWRAAGARQPKGVVEGSVVPEGASVGQVLKAEAEIGVDGITITSFAPVKTRQRREPERIEIVGTRRDEPDVITTLAPKGRGGRDRGDRGDRRGGRGRDGRDGRDGRGRSDGGRGREGGRDSRDRRGGEGRGRRDRPERVSSVPERPKPKRLRPGRTHSNALLKALDPAQRPLAEIVLRDGLPGVRATIDRMNKAAVEHDQPKVNPDPVMDLAEKLLPHLRAAEWRDRAEAALASVDEVDLRDLRQVVVAADANARDDETRALGEQLRAAVGSRVDAEHASWLTELEELMAEGRLVRALRLSSRPPKAGAPLPAELADAMVTATATALGPDTGTERYATVVDALAYSPVHARVTPAAIPSEPGEALLASVRKVADRVPQIATAFGIDPTTAGRGRGRGRGRGKAAATKSASTKAPAPVPPPPSKAASDAPAGQAPEEEPSTQPSAAPPADEQGGQPGEAAQAVGEPTEPAAAPTGGAEGGEAPAPEAPVTETAAPETPFEAAPVDDGAPAGASAEAGSDPGGDTESRGDTETP